MKGKLGLFLLGTYGDDDGVSCIVAPRTTSYHVHVSAEDVDELSFALVSPLRAKHDGDCQRTRMVKYETKQQVNMHSPLMMSCPRNHNKVQKLEILPNCLGKGKYL